MRMYSEFIGHSNRRTHTHSNQGSLLKEFTNYPHVARYHDFGHPTERRSFFFFYFIFMIKQTFIADPSPIKSNSCDTMMYHARQECEFYLTSAFA